jgi:hypothetical protein
MPLFALALISTFDFNPAVRIAVVALSRSPIPPPVPAKEVKSGRTASYVINLHVASGLPSITFVPLEVDVAADDGLGRHVSGRTARGCRGTARRCRWKAAASVMARSSAMTQRGARSAPRFGPRSCVVRFSAQPAFFRSSRQLHPVGPRRAFLHARAIPARASHPCSARHTDPRERSQRRRPRPAVTARANRHPMPAPQGSGARSSTKRFRGPRHRLARPCAPASG